MNSKVHMKIKLYMKDMKLMISRSSIVVNKKYTHFQNLKNYDDDAYDRVLRWKRGEDLRI